MPFAALSLKVPLKLRTRIEQLCRRSGESVHAFMLRALEGQVEAAERYQAFIDEGIRADEAMRRSGLGYAAGDVHAYFEAKLRGRAARQPKPLRWRR